MLNFHHGQIEKSGQSEYRQASLASLAKGVEFGRSVREVPLEYLPAAEENCEVLVMAGTHGEEPETTVTLSRALRSLAAPLRSVACVLTTNPDGLASGTRGNANGVDLNRNFPTGDWQAEPVHYRWHLEEKANVPITTGTGPASEPETRALLSLLDALNPRLILSLHAPLACIDDPEETPAARWLAGRTGLPLVGGVGYPTPGSLGTWAREQRVSLVTWEFPRKSIEELSRECVPVLTGFFREVEAGAF